MTATKLPHDDAPTQTQGRARTGHLYWRLSGWRARLTLTIDGESVQKSFDLGTTNKAAARAKMKRLLADHLAPVEHLKAKAVHDETFAEAVARVIGRQKSEGLKTWKDRQSRLTRYAVPELGPVPVTQIRTAAIRETLDLAAKQGLSHQTIVHIKNDLNGIFADLWRDEVISENPVARIKIQKGLRKDTRRRVILSDEEFDHFASSPEVPERLYLMSLVSRCFGGMRTSDLHGWDWSHVDLETWKTAAVYRPKTDDGQTELPRLILPDVVRRPLHAYWTQQGEPKSGPVFPVTKGNRAGCPIARKLTTHDQRS